MLEELHRRNFADATIRTYMHGVERRIIILCSQIDIPAKMPIVIFCDTRTSKSFSNLSDLLRKFNLNIFCRGPLSICCFGEHHAE